MEEKEFEELSEMFQSDGWKSFTSNLTELEETIMKVAPDNAVTGDQWQYCRGQVHQLRRIIGYRDFIELSWENQQAETNVDPI
jgi:hypothetical protein